MQQLDNASTIIDLFAGVGGLSLGAARAGFQVSLSVELDPYANATHALNFPQTQHLSSDVAGLGGKELLSRIGLEVGELAGLIGGPPCQGFSCIGKRNVLDTRNNLFGHFFRLVRETMPSFYVAENVPGVLDPRYEGLRADAFALIPKNYVQLAPLIVRASDYGAPTVRTRVFFIGFKQESLRNAISEQDFLPPPGTLPVTVGKALEGLPVLISPQWKAEDAGWGKVSPFKISDNFALSATSRVPESLGHPPTLERYFERSEVSGCLGTTHTSDVIARFAAIKQGEIERISRCVRLAADGFCPTLRAGTSREKGSFQAVRPIHYAQNRVITAREAARLQGFPDWFRFHDTKWHSFRQIGNSVSPIVAEKILSTVRSKLL